MLASPGLTPLVVCVYVCVQVRGLQDGPVLSYGLRGIPGRATHPLACATPRAVWSSREGGLPPARPPHAAARAHRVDLNDLGSGSIRCIPGSWTRCTCIMNLIVDLIFFFLRTSGTCDPWFNIYFITKKMPATPKPKPCCFRPTTDTQCMPGYFATSFSCSCQLL